MKIEEEESDEDEENDEVIDDEEADYDEEDEETVEENNEDYEDDMGFIFAEERYQTRLLKYFSQNTQRISDLL